MDKKVTLLVNGEEISLKPFVVSIFFTTISGMVDALSRIPENKDKIEIKIG